jgi:hypothetical protein
VTACAFRADARKIGLAAIEDEPSGLCDSADLLPSLSGAVLRPSAPRERVPPRRARHRPDAELRAGHRRKTPADRLHLGSIFNSRGGRRREARCLAASDVRLHPPLAGESSLAFAPGEAEVKVRMGLHTGEPTFGEEATSGSTSCAGASLRLPATARRPSRWAQGSPRATDRRVCQPRPFGRVREVRPRENGVGRWLLKRRDDRTT